MDISEVRQSKWNEGIVDVGGGFVGIPCIHITRDPRIPRHARHNDAGKYNGLDHCWAPKLVPDSGVEFDEPFPQRTPDDTVDNITICYKEGMTEPVLVLGEFKKDVDINGEKVKMHGLCVAAGGHYERLGRRPAYFKDKGAPDLIDAALSELEEEINVTEDGIVASEYVGFIDHPSNDPRKHVVRHVILRWIDIDPTESEELARLVCVPLSRVDDLMNGKIRIKVEGEPLGFVLGHDSFLKLVLTLPNVVSFINRITDGS